MRLSGPRAWVLAPVLAAQAAYVIAGAMRLPEAAGARQGEAGSGPRLRLLILGDSSAAGVGVADQGAALAGQLVQRLAERFHLSWRLVAQSGVTTAGALSLLEREAAGRFDVALSALGVNDATRLRAPERFRADQARLGQVLRARFGVARLVRSAVPPLGEFRVLPRPLRDVIGARAVALDRVLQDLCAAEPGSLHLPFDAPLRDDLLARDGFHPGAALYALWAQRAAEAILADRLSGAHDLSHEKL